MNGLTSGTGRFAQPKIKFSCSCGKKYRVSSSKAGKRVRCKNCRLKIRVPGNPAISMRSRKAILAEFGIDAEQAEQEYRAERERGYTCTLCGSKLATDGLRAAYGRDGLVCSSCKASQVAERGEPSEEKKRKTAKKLESWTSGPSADAVRTKAIGYAALFCLGSAGFAHTVLGLGTAGVVVIAAAIGAIGYRAIVNAEG